MPLQPLFLMAVLIKFPLFPAYQPASNNIFQILGSGRSSAASKVMQGWELKIKDGLSEADKQYSSFEGYCRKQVIYTIVGSRRDTAFACSGDPTRTEYCALSSASSPCQQASRRVRSPLVSVKNLEFL